MQLALPSYTLEKIPFFGVEKSKHLQLLQYSFYYSSVKAFLLYTLYTVTLYLVASYNNSKNNLIFKILKKLSLYVPVQQSTKMKSSLFFSQYSLPNSLALPGKMRAPIEGFFLPYRLDRNKHRGGIAVYIREDNPSKF